MGGTEDIPPRGRQAGDIEQAARAWLEATARLQQATGRTPQQVELVPGADGQVSALRVTGPLYYAPEHDQAIRQAFGIPGPQVAMPGGFTPEAVVTAGLPPGIERCSSCGCGQDSALMSGPPSQRLCTRCDAKRIAPPPAADEPVAGRCEGCRMDSFVTNVAGRKLCLWCAELDDENKRLAGQHAPAAMRRAQVAGAAALVLVLASVAVVIGLHGWLQWLALPVFLAGRKAFHVATRDFGPEDGEQSPAAAGRGNEGR